MSEFAFYGLKPALRDKLPLGELPMPVRKARRAAVFGTEGVAVDQLLVELDVFLTENPELGPRYADAAGLLAHAVGTELASSNRVLEAIGFFAMGLRHRPDNLSLRTRYAVALQAAGREEEAARQYEQIIGNPHVKVTPVVWILAARLHATAGRYARARDLLRQCLEIGFDDPAFLRFLREMEQRATPPGRTAPGAGTDTCSNCGKSLTPGRKFCTGCGTRVGQ